MFLRTNIACLHLQSFIEWPKANQLKQSLLKNFRLSLKLNSSNLTRIYFAFSFVYKKNYTTLYCEYVGRMFRMQDHLLTQFPRWNLITTQIFKDTCSFYREFFLWLSLFQQIFKYHNQVFLMKYTTGIFQSSSYA